MRDLVRQEVFDASETIVIKIGSNVLTRDDDLLDTDRIATLASQIADLKSTGRNVVIVSSGAVAAGVGVLGLSKRPTSLPELQASAAAGQMLLMPLQANVLGEQAKRVVGSLMRQLLTQTFMRRGKEQRHPTVVIIDEFADMAGSMVGELTKTLLAEARKFGVAVVLNTR